MTDLKINCPACGCPDQHVGLNCGFCRAMIDVPPSALTDGGTLRVEEVIGYRAWKVVRNSDGVPELRSPLYRQVWEPGVWAIAECQNRTLRHGVDNDHRPDHEDRTFWPPVKDCGGSGHGCGFYAGRSREHLMSMSYPNYTETEHTVIGRVQMAGKIIPASNGWRAQKVRPRTIYVPYEFWELARDLKAVYEPHGVEVDVTTTLLLPKQGEGAIEWCRKCSAKMGRTLTCEFCGYTHV